jgi:hypothetical protein
MFLWYPVLDLARAPRRTTRKRVRECLIAANKASLQQQKLQKIHF